MGNFAENLNLGNRFRPPLGIINAIEALYESSKSAVLLGDEISDWFCTHVGVRQGCLLSPTIFNIYLEYIMTEALDGFEGAVSIGGRTVTNLRFDDDIDLVAGQAEELGTLHQDKKRVLSNLACRSVRRRAKS